MARTEDDADDDDRGGRVAEGAAERLTPDDPSEASREGEASASAREQHPHDAPDGTLIARLSRDEHGGAFELFDDRHEACATAPRPNPYVDDDGDPWSPSKSLPSAREPRPGPGF